MIIALICLVIIFCYLSVLTKGTKNLFNAYEKELLKRNENIPFEYFLGRTKDFGNKFIDRIIVQYNITKNKEHLYFLLWNEILGESFAYLCISIFIMVAFFVFLS